MDSFVSHAKPARTNLGATVLLNCASTGPKRTARGGIPVPPLNPAVIIPPPLISSLIQLDSHCVASAFLWWTELPLHRQPALATVSCTTLWWYYSEGKCARVLDHAVPSCCKLKHNIVSLLWAISLSFFLKFTLEMIFFHPRRSSLLLKRRFPLPLWRSKMSKCGEMNATWAEWQQRACALLRCFCGSSSVW